MIKVAIINHFNGMNSKIPQDGDKIRVIAYLMRCVCGKVKVQLYYLHKRGLNLNVFQQFKDKKKSLFYGICTNIKCQPRLEWCNEISTLLGLFLDYPSFQIE